MDFFLVRTGLLLENDLGIDRAVIGRHAFIHHLEILHRPGIGRIQTEIIEQDPRLIGRKLILNQGIRNIQAPATLDEFTDLVISLGKRIKLNEKAGEVPEPDWSRFTISADCGWFGPWFHQDDNRFTPKLPKRTFRKSFPGNFATLPSSEFPPDQLLMMRFRFELEEARSVRIMFNTNANGRVWIDGDYAFGREGGRMAPSFHRAPCNQFKDMELAAGTHELLAGIAPLDGIETVSFVFGVSDRESRQWIPVKWL